MGSGNLCASCYQLDKEQILGRLNLKWLGSGLVRGEGGSPPHAGMSSRVAVCCDQGSHLVSGAQVGKCSLVPGSLGAGDTVA